MNLISRLNRSLTLFAIVPLTLLLLGINVAAWYVFNRKHWSELENVELKVRSELDQRLATEIGRLRVLGSLSATEELLGVGAPRSAAAGSGAGAGIQPKGPVLNQGNALAASALNNPAAEILQRAQASRAFISGLLLTDHEGVVLASSGKTQPADCSDKPWWVLAKMRGPGEVVSDGMSSGRLMGLALGLGQAGEASALRGVLCEQLDMDRLTRDLVSSARMGDTAVMVMGGAWTVGAGEAGEQVIKGLAARLRQAEEERGWYAGVRYLARPLGADISWGQPVWIVVIKHEALLPFGIYGLAAAVFALSVLIALLCARYFRGFFAREIIGPQAELLEAGDWILRTALGRSAVIPQPMSKDPAKRALPEATPLQRELQKWLHRVLQDLQDEYTTQTFEMQRDLNLARDFQQAYIDRAYPKIPAVHVDGRLRLEFYHRYEPALALGGDFYNILTLAPDCAGVFIADVMGHGTRSALITAIIRTLIDDLAPQGRNARHFLTEMNKLFCGLLRSVPTPLYASCFYFVADTTARVATYSSAGHPAPFQIRRSAQRVARLEVPMPRGTALGLLPSENYTGGYSRLVDGDVFILFTDGVYEARNTRGEEFGIARMEQTLQSMMFKSAKEMVDGMMEAISNFVGYEPISDDICIVAVEATTKLPPH
ncbi:MAG: PP2C family protein-serine/threonine phosphatase [Verrucomicrobiota bacterium]